MSPDACHLYLVRHGATAHNLLDPPRMQGRHIDEPLDPTGQRQATQAAAALAKAPIQAVYSSPLRRAFETAQAIADRHRLAPVVVEDLAEVDVGRWEDRSWIDIAKNDTEAYEAFRNDPAAQGYPEGENLGDVTLRVVAAIDQIALGHPSERIVVVAHSVVNRLYLGQLLSVPLALRRRLPQDNCAISEVAWQSSRARPITINAIGHLDAN